MELTQCVYNPTKNRLGVGVAVNFPQHYVFQKNKFNSHALNEICRRNYSHVVRLLVDFESDLIC